jgi:hypothetical protein
MGARFVRAGEGEQISSAEGVRGGGGGGGGGREDRGTHSFCKRSTTISQGQHWRHSNMTWGSGQDRGSRKRHTGKRKVSGEREGRVCGSSAKA